MTVGLMIPGVSTFWPRESWEEAGYRMAVDYDHTPTRQKPGSITQPVVHYSSALDLPDGDIGEHDYQIPPWLRSSMRDYMQNRKGGGYIRLSDGRYFPGYPLGYLFAVDWLGGVWELRGFDYQAAANAGHNGYTAPLLFITDRYDPGTELQWAAARAVWREFRRRSGRTDFANRPLGHGELFTTTGSGTPTICPGDALLAQLHAGYGDLNRGDPAMTIQAPLPLLAGSERAYDSRPANQGDVDLVLGHANRDVPKVRLQPGETRRIFVGLCSAVEVNVTCVGSGRGFVRVAPTATGVRSSAVNYDQDGVAANCVPVATPDGHIYVSAVGAPCDFIIDVYSRG